MHKLGLASLGGPEELRGTEGNPRSQRVPGIPRVPRDPPLRLKGPGNLRVPRLAEGPWNSQVAKHPNAPRTPRFFMKPSISPSTASSLAPFTR